MAKTVAHLVEKTWERYWFWTFVSVQNATLTDFSLADSYALEGEYASEALLVSVFVVWSVFEALSVSAVWNASAFGVGLEAATSGSREGSAVFEVLIVVQNVFAGPLHADFEQMPHDSA